MEINKSFCPWISGLLAFIFWLSAFISWRHRIIPTSSPGMATTKSFHSQNKPFPGTMDFQCFYHVVGTSRRVATRSRKQWRYGRLIKPNQCDEYPGKNVFYFQFIKNKEPAIYLLLQL